MPTRPMKVILFNGPPRSGKDTATDMAMDIIRYRGFPVQRYRFASPLKRAVHELFGFAGAPDEYFSSSKEKMAERLFGMSPRQAYIWLSEEVAKPKFGSDFFAKVAVTAISRMRDELGAEVVVVSDCGFAEEAIVLCEAFGPENVHIVQLHRPGCDFTGDSRKYISGPEGSNLCMIANRGSLNDLQKAVATYLKEVLK